MILSGTVTYQSPVTVTLDYTIPTSSGSSAAGGGGSSSSGTFAPKISVMIGPIRTVSLYPGETVTALLAVNWTGVNNIRVTSIEFTGAVKDWVTLAESLPKALFKQIGEDHGTGEVEVRIIAPENAQPGEYTVPVIIHAEAVGSRIETNGYLTFSIIQKPAPISLVPEYMTLIFAAALAGIILYAYLKD